MADTDVELEVWKTTVEVQKHFNELSLKVRSIAVTVLGAFLAAAGYALKESKTVDFLGEQVSLTGTILLGALVCWAAFFVMDRLWYHRLLRAAVQHGRAVEDALEKAIPTIGLAGAIDKASPVWGMRAGHRLTIFYGFIAVLLWLGAGNALRASSPYYILGIVLFLTAVALELASRGDTPVDKRRGFRRMGLLAGAIYFGWWAITYWFASSGMAKYLKWSREAADKGDWNASGTWMQAANEAGDAMTASIVWAIVVPIMVLLIWGLFYWVRRGFEPHN